MCSSRMEQHCERKAWASGFDSGPLITKDTANKAPGREACSSEPRIAKSGRGDRKIGYASDPSLELIAEEQALRTRRFKCTKAAGAGNSNRPRIECGCAILDHC